MLVVKIRGTVQSSVK